ncbi:efflux transporter outer membrane subunit [Paucibacter sp. R3-3]|uniref:Efflux transporter outer membrane subunit n=1 Tax=Roseateles agri TaxID=3098619 RepID=A0ABU5DRP0_9BURK|nr:efflux transporter outer membrane subunit [Paucibacter sp. R3-3]MDY0748990.1 efflux transporter outer membrane subunit [Paucibacter sp. R3-3]
MTRNLFSIAALLMLSACAGLTPEYKRPEAPVAASWPTGPAYAPAAAASSTAADLPWQSFILDERLRQVVTQALAGSRSLRKTISDIESARAQYGEQRAALVPTVQANVSGSASRALNGGSGNAASTTHSYSAAAGVSSYELDLFGRVRSLTGAALETYLASEEASRSTRISLIASTATAWFTLAADQSLLELSRRTLAAAEQTMALTRKRLDVGVASRVDVTDAETIYQQARADVASATTAVAQDRNALELLVGGPVADALLPGAAQPASEWLADVPAGLSSEVLLRRPDVLQAEHQLKAANANIGAARAAFFPQLTLTGSAGLASTALSSLFSGGASVWSAAPALGLTLFDGGAHRSALQYSQAQRDGYVAAYELAVQTAFRETADALARQGTMAEQLAAQQALVAAAQASYQLASDRYSKGVDTFLNALVAQRTLYSAQQTLATTQLTALTNRVTLYKALGGGAVGS